MTAPWLSSMPQHWRAQPLGYLVRTMGGGTPAKEEPAFWSGSIPWVSPKDMKRPLIADSEDHVSQLALDRTVLRLIPPPAVLVVVRGMILDHTFPVAETTAPVTLNQDMKALLPRSGVVARFLAYALRGLESALLSLVEEAGHGTKKVRTDLWRKFELPVPPLDDQRAIADFLDQKTAAIDALIAKKERLLVLLDEKRQALITQAVTKGLDPSVRMKESGVEWLGPIPCHWHVRRLAMITTRIGNGFVGPTRDILVDDGIPYLQSLHIKQGKVLFEKKYFVSNDWLRAHEKARLVEGDLVIVQTGDVGQTAVIPAQFHRVGCHALIIVRFKRGIGSGAYFARFFQSHVGLELLLREQTGALHPHLECGKVRDLPVIVPPEREQAQILTRVDDMLGQFEQLVGRTERTIDRLREYRQALITSAVTGQLDVRSKHARAMEPAA